MRCRRMRVAARLWSQRRDQGSAASERRATTLLVRRAATIGGPWVPDGCVRFRGRLGLPLTLFAREVDRRLSHGTARTCLYAVRPFFTFVANDTWQRATARRMGQSA